ncbi:cytochrome P450 [Aspergillus granulosus]|uniref:Cytochrome P450 n=1 Tax=Aspergillus granulosus TaxID=176169 RepID=A0ABR4I4S3_9EURO
MFQPWYALLGGALVVLLVFTRLLLALQSLQTLHLSKASSRSPPVHPYWIPFVGHSVQFIQKPGEFIDELLRQYRDKHPVEIVLGPVRGYFVSGCDVVNTLLRSPRNLSPKPFIALAMENMFGTPRSAMPMYRNDNSGIAPIPLPNTHVAPEHRIYYHQHKSAHRFLTGDALRGMTDRFMRVLSEELHGDLSIAPDDDWVQLPDLYTFWRSRIFHAAVHALFGPYLPLLTPSFETDFWNYIDAIPTLVMGLPRWMTPAAYAARDRVFTAVKIWHRFARAHSDYRCNSPEGPEWDKYWGSAWLKVRQQFGKDSGCMDEDALAAEDVALLVAANANAILSAIWLLLHISTDPDLRRQLLPEFDRAITTISGSSKATEFDVNALTSSARLQSAYAEVLRMRIALLLNRTPVRSSYQLGPWRLQRGQFIVMSTQHAAFDEKAWGPQHTAHGKHPLDTFWAERFLVRDAEGVEQFSVDGLGGAWIPYGGGGFMCPGRHFAKQEILGSVAVFQAYYELELVDRPSGWVPEPDRRFYGVGAMPPAEPIPFRIRRRKLL